MAKEQTIRVSAKGEFGQLSRGLKQLQQDLKGVSGVVDKGANRGGFFDDKQLRALEIYKRRFSETMQELDGEFRKQNDLVESLYTKMQTAQRSERSEIQKTIREREKNLDVIRKELIAAERLYNTRTKESGGFKSSGSGGSGGLNADGINNQLNNGIIGKFMKSTAGRAMTMGKMGLGLAGIGGIGAVVSQSYGLAYDRQVNSLDLAQRMRGQKGWAGDGKDMWDKSGDVGRSDRMGYSSAESWGFLDQYTRLAGNINTDQQKGLMKFGRSYGLTTDEVAGATGTNRASGGMSTPKAFADAIAGSVSESGMTPRILEVMETNNTLLQQMNTTLKDGSTQQILAYQTTLDKIGNENGMKQLTGASGGSMISGLGGIFSPDNDNWKWMGVRALQGYKPEKYGKMDLFDLEESYEDGLMNEDNIPAMAKYVKGVSGGNDKLTKRIMQRWLTDGGFAATKRQASEFYDATDGLTAFNPEQIESMKNGSIDSGAKYDTERADQTGQGFLDIDAKYKESLTDLGNQFVEIVNELKEGAGGFVGTLVQGFDAVSETVKTLEEGLGQFVEDTLIKLGVSEETSSNVGETVSNITGYVAENPVEAGAIGAGAYAGFNILKKVKNWFNPASKAVTTAEAVGGGAATAGGGFLTKLLSNKFIGPLASVGTADMAMEAGDGVGDWFFGHDKGQLKTPGLFDNPFSKEAYGDDRQGALSKGWDWLWGNSGGIGDSDIGRMPGEVTENVEDMSTSGQKNFKSMDRSTTDMAKDANDKYKSMEYNSKDLTTKGTWFFRQMLYTVQNKMSDIYSEHQGIKEMIADLLGGGTTLTGLPKSLEDGYSITSKITDMTGISASDLDKKLSGVLKGKGAQFVKSGLANGIDPAALAAIAIQESGNGTSPLAVNKNNIGGMRDGKNGWQKFDSIEDGIEAMARNLKKNYVDQGVDTIEAVQHKYAPIGAKNDPDNMNNDWSKGVVSIANGLIGGMSTGSGDGFFNGWQDRITSKFGANESIRTHTHAGLDIKGSQGDKVGALTGGEVSFIKMDDGSKLDPDGKANTESGGTQVGVKMKDGKTYFYAHLSKVNSDLKVGQTVGSGDWIGNVGGAPGVAGSGSSTTGSHLHLGYLNSAGERMDPEQLLRSLGTGGGFGDSDLGIAAKGSANQSVTKSEITVNLNITGEGAKTLNKVTGSHLEKLVKKIVAESEKQKLRMSPTKVGYS
ncbi:peptidoglycan DD-metalloendopeptidase family protein [Paenibacillus nuruki]|uniref:peptidoglycan DD-metalloendopeptidase family protein n=1 Tax=Paenibacillus nuruki TaxID=1886670 RepID=UPI002804C5E6|nr:peptidoglycan DD-metalloendopeptidase family protein [Paenibacillus nuruki]CAJ1315911.1 peptidoglycan DD-metalloendopeptidase family protein [Paenibacillus nuruki]